MEDVTSANFGHKVLSRRLAMNSDLLALDIFSPATQLYDCYPGGNETYLAVNPSIRPDQYAQADALIRQRHRYFEHGAFLESPVAGGVVRVHVSGGEFSANAARCAAALVFLDVQGGQRFSEMADYSRIRVFDDNSVYFPLEVSGTEKIINASVSPTLGGFDVTIEIPAYDDPVNVTRTNVMIDSIKRPCTVVELDGIVQVLIPHESLRFMKDGQYLASCMREVRSHLKLENTPATGMAWYGNHNGEWRIDPVTYVNETGTCIYESACGSGSIALAMALSTQPGETLKVRQPSGYVLAVSLPSLIETHGDDCIMLCGRVDLRGDLNEISLAFDEAV